jgi:hypothetical protein
MARNRPSEFMGHGRIVEEGATVLDTQRRFTAPDAWTGGFYELKIRLGAPSDERISQALTSVWESSLLEGPYCERHKEPADQPRISPTEDHLYGVAHISGRCLPFSTFVLREEDQHGNRHADFLYLCLPLGGLGTIYSVGAYPFGSLEAARTWRPEVDAWFLQLLRGLKRPFTFQLGVLGFEVEMTVAEVPNLTPKSTSGEHFYGIILPGNDGLQWHPPTSYES